MPDNKAERYEIPSQWIRGNLCLLATLLASDIDNCSYDVCTGSNITFSINKSSFDCSDIGTQSVQLQVTDAKGNIWLNVFTIDNNEPVSWHASGLIRFNPATNTCTVWDTTNSKIPSNSVYNIKEREGTIYFLSDNSSKLVKFENDEFTIIKEAPVSHPKITRYFLWPDGTINYLVKAEKVDEYTYERNLLKDESGRNVFLGLSPDHFFSNNLFFHKDSERNTYILDSPNEPDIYPGYAFTSFIN